MSIEQVGKDFTVHFLDDDGYYKVVYRDTLCVKYDLTSITLNSKGRISKTITVRMNVASHVVGLGYRVYIKMMDNVPMIIVDRKLIHEAGYPGGEVIDIMNHPAPNNEINIPYEDGMVLKRMR